MSIRSRIEPAEGRRRSFVAHNGQPVVLPVIVSAWEDDPVTGERLWTATARVELIDRHPRTTQLHVQAEDGLDVEKLQREFRWRAPSDIVSLWVPNELAMGGTLEALEPPSSWWVAEGRHELTHEFLTEVAQEYLRLGRGYAKPMAVHYRTSERTVRSWVDRARDRGILGPAPGRGRTGGEFAVMMTEED